MGIKISLPERQNKCIRNKFIYDIEDVESEFYQEYLQLAKKYISKINKLIHNNDVKNAIEALKIFCKNFNEDIISTNLSVANFAYKHGFHNQSIKRSFKIYQQLSKNLKNDSFKNYLKDKSIAIVGNSGREIGKNRGKEIDSHDVVFRFNNYPDGYEKDYGCKCNVWIRGFGGKGEIHDRTLDNYDYIYIPAYLLDMNIPNHISDWLYKTIKKYPQKLVFVPNDVFQNIKNYNNPKPTTGFKAFIHLISLIGNTDIDIYGFSFLDKGGDNDNAHIYDSRTLAGHSMNEERKILREIFKDKIE